MDFVKNRKVYFIISALLIIVGIVFSIVNGFNLGIDFSGGTIITIQAKEFIEEAKIRDIFNKYDETVGIQYSGANKEEIIVKSTKDFDTNQMTEIKYDLEEKFGLDRSAISSDSTEPTMGKEIQRKAVISILITSALMLLYITIRFEFMFGLAAIIALLHDVLITLGFYAVFKFPVNSSLIAAILTIVGYSINATIIIFDRIREDIKLQPKASKAVILNSAVNQTLRRSIFTTITTLVAVFTLYYVGVEAVKVLALPLIVGMISGFWSSVFIAPNLWYTLTGGESNRAKVK
ncbi:MAG: protein translocase subunit SecF [Ezakiella sp.]|nr:protein translocase subunit SecF [Ezakiella sp.]MDD7471933.1 protein translocase subunit SecF [Bacillota bacterium]MDY3923897.1 protein translocase subunit SecF [Ezakiella sp.]